MRFLSLIWFVMCTQALMAQCDSQIYIPEKFDWNRMTDTTRFKPVFHVSQPDVYEFTIHDKWGETVFSTGIPEQGWNGLMNNRKGNCTAGTYMWSLNCTWSGDSVSVYCMGYVTCMNSRAVKVTALDTLQCRPTMFVLNAITPNGDGLNEDFRPVFGCTPVEYQMQIFDRWGNLIFETKDPDKGWDGTHDGRSAQVDTYVWKINVLFYEGDKKRQMIGHVALIR